MLDLTTGKLNLYFKADTRYAVKAYIFSDVPHTTEARLYHQFTILFNVGDEFVYPDCSPWCLYDPANGSPANLQNQKPNRRYYSSTAAACWNALSTCPASTCLAANPMSSNSAADGTVQTCTSSYCTGAVL